jgi:hypothetical protein
MDYEKPLSMIAIQDFLGQVSNMDKHDVPPGAAVEQVNMACTKIGQMQVRGGYRVITYEAQ